MRKKKTIATVAYFLLVLPLVFIIFLSTAFKQLRSGICDADVSGGDVPDADASDVVF